jgi:hypothetical protein
MCSTEWMEEQQNEKGKWRAREYIALLSAFGSIHISNRDTSNDIVTSSGVPRGGLGDHPPP